MELLKNCKGFFKDLRSDTAFNEMPCNSRELADEIDIPANFELTQPRHRVRRRNVNVDYEARDDPIEDPTLKYKAEFYFFTLDKAMNALESKFYLISTNSSYFQFLYNVCDLKDTPQNNELKYCKDLETVLTDGNSSDINVLDLAGEIVAVLALLNKNESPIEILKFISNLYFSPNLGIVLRILLTLPISVASGERSCFSKLKLIKKFLHSTTTKNRLNSLTTTAIEHELTEEINVKVIIKKFSQN
ncbi:uncharacterized protein TNCV_2917991 [Trichonephila clavipes]|nr:uncharacterized protein TNCV_2917991 [Trichonephila clavipes]